MGIGEQHELEKTGSIVGEKSVECIMVANASYKKRPQPDENVLWIEYDPMHEEFFALIKQMCDTFLAKNSDYAGSDAVDMMKNFMACQEFGIKMSDGIATRMSDKIMRMQNLMRTRTQRVKDESLIDSTMDLANYCLLLTIALKREKQNEVLA